MKIAYLANVRFPSERAHSVQIAHMCQAFAAVGNTVDLFVSQRGGADSVEDFYGFPPKFSVERLRPRRIFPQLKFTFFIGELIFALQFCFRRHSQYHIVYARSEWILWILSWLIGSDRLVFESHEAKYNIAVRSLLRQGVKTVVISKGIQDFYRQQSVPTSQLIIADDGIDDSFFNTPVQTDQVRQELSLDKNANIAMYVGGLNQWKGVETFMQAQKFCKYSQFDHYHWN
jgi:hypothetical protein